MSSSLSAVLGPTKFNWWYASIIDLMIANPQMLQHEMAARLGVTPNWLSLVVNSDAFKAVYAQRREEHSKSISKHVQETLHETTELALDMLMDKLKTNAPKMTVEQTLDVADVLLNRMGYNSKGNGANPAQPQNAPASVVQQVVVVPVSVDAFHAAQDQLRNIERQRLHEPFVLDEKPYVPLTKTLEQSPVEDDPRLRNADVVDAA